MLTQAVGDRAACVLVYRRDSGPRSSPRFPIPPNLTLKGSPGGLSTTQIHSNRGTASPTWGSSNKTWGLGGSQKAWRLPTSATSQTGLSS